MANYRTCMNCAVEPATCKRRATIAAAIKGMGVTSVKFNCTDRLPLFAPGQRVSVSWSVPDPYGEFTEYTLETWPATVCAEHGSKFLIVVDDVPSDHETPARDYIKNETLFCRVSAGKLAPLDEPARTICTECKGCSPDYSGCWTDPTMPQYGPNHCAKKGNIDQVAG